MSLRFNAPPGWQVPADFFPPAGWQPDPSWPPAPPGWQFWLGNDTHSEEHVEQPDPEPQIREASPEQVLQSKLTERRAARTQLVSGLGMFAVAVVIFIFTDNVYYIVALVGAISAIAGLFNYLRADRAVRKLSNPLGVMGGTAGVPGPTSTLGGMPGPSVTPGTNYGSGTGYGSSGTPPTITQVSPHLKNDDGTMPGQWKV